jgi:hypothetical protein
MVEFKNQQDYNIFTKLQNDYLSEQITSNQNKFRNKNFNNLVDFGFAKMYLGVRLFNCEFIK